jgi:diadenosine tetraphosphate (Ap4A) HIT family hydrolase
MKAEEIVFTLFFAGGKVKQVQIALNDDIGRKLDNRALELGVTLDEFLTKAIEQNSDKLIRPKAWMPRAKWDALVRGDNCNDCAHLASGQNPHGYQVADLRVSRLDLFKSQFVPGCCILYLRRHVVEPYELSVEERTLYFEDLMRSAQAIANVFKPAKMNYQILGNGGPHLHCFLQPRFYGDSEPGWPIDPYIEQVILRPEEYQERVRAIQRALEKVEH